MMPDAVAAPLASKTQVKHGDGVRLFIASIKAGECEREEEWKMEDRVRDGAAAGCAS